MLPVQNVATLITGTNRADLTAEKVDRVSAILEAASSGAELVAAQWLDENVACDVVFTGLSETDARSALADELPNVDFDIVVQRRPGRRRDFLFTELDRVVLTSHPLIDAAAFVGKKEEMVALIEAIDSGEIDGSEGFHQQLALLQGMSGEALAIAFEKCVLGRGLRTLVHTMRSHGARTAMITGGLDYFCSRVRDASGFDDATGTSIDLSAGVISGQINGEILDGEAKLAEMERLARQHAVPLSETMAVGRAIADLPMLKAAGLGVAFHAVPAVREAMDTCIDHGDLSALLFLQGYAAEEFSI